MKIWRVDVNGEREEQLAGEEGGRSRGKVGCQAEALELYVEEDSREGS